MRRSTILLLATLSLLGLWNVDVCDASDLQVGGELSGRAYLYNQDAPTTSARATKWAKGKLVLRSEIGDWRAQFTGLADAGNGEMFDYGVDLLGDELVRHSLNLGESFLQREFESADVTAGALEFSWGTADEVNPTDLLNPRDYTDVLDNEKLPVFGGGLQYFWDEMSLTGVLLPVFIPSRLPFFGNRWFPELPKEVSISGQTLPAESILYPFGRNLPSVGLDDMQFAVKLDGTTEGWDWFLSFFRGYNTVPLFELIVQPGNEETAPVNLLLNPVYPRQNVIGGGYSTYFGKIGFRGEAAYFDDTNGTGDSYLQIIVGTDYRWSNLADQGDLTAILQYSYEVVTDRGLIPNPLPQPPLGRVFTNNLILNLEMDFHNDTELNIEATGNFDDYDGVVRAELQRQLTDDVTATLGGDILFGDETGFFGQYSHNDRIFLLIKKAF